MSESPGTGRGGAPWTFAGLLGVGVTMSGIFGLRGAAGIVVASLAVVFIVFLIRHVAFAASALATAHLDMSGEGTFDYGFRPRVTVMVPCHNEELVLEGMIECLMAFDYPAELLELFVIDDGSTDRTGPMLDELTRRDARPRVLQRSS